MRRAPWIVQSGDYDLRRHQVAEFEVFARALLIDVGGN
jgi:hypothetical protein